ncbi:hypothetical protein [Oligoflexus tunisiensis]|uniref:hypothetical protein n=1 Tax=Oligoflexus tunisiensis TaxID=708132 RepID=UPI00114C880E|nr:hypothetical protein [Oligoflexus tunisiensis]
MRFIFALIAFVTLSSTDAFALKWFGGTTFYEFCAKGAPDGCVLARTERNGDFTFIVRDMTRVNGLPYGHRQRGPTGDWVASISAAAYNSILAAGVERVEVDPYSGGYSEIAQIDRDIAKNARRCILLVAACTTAALGSVGNWWAIGGAALGCVIAGWDCDDLKQTNQALLRKREEIDAEIKAEIEKQNEEQRKIDANAAWEGRGREGGEPGRPSPGPGGAPRTPPPPLPGGVVTIRETPPTGGSIFHPAHPH